MTTVIIPISSMKKLEAVKIKKCVQGDKLVDVGAAARLQLCKGPTTTNWLDVMPLLVTAPRPSALG